MTRWAALAVAGCLLTITGLYWYVRALEDHARRWPLAAPLRARRWPPAWPVAVFLVGCVVVLAALVGAVQEGD